ncbi:penicillin-binding protein [Colletotrichum incanum]|nr:penicillin-binding protein [Colletotrichum incanum]
MNLKLLSYAMLLHGSCASANDAQQILLKNNDRSRDHPRVVSPDLDAYIQDIMQEWHAPGLAVAIVDGDKTWAKVWNTSPLSLNRFPRLAMCRKLGTRQSLATIAAPSRSVPFKHAAVGGYGYAALNSTWMTPHTLFYTGSTTKSFTAAGLSLLIDNATVNSSVYSGLTWKTPVSSVLRDDFVLSDEWATAHITLEDALSHRTGYPRHDLASAKTTRETVRLLRHLPLAAEPRATFLYNNKMYGAMGYLIEVLTGSWLGDFFREHLWMPMGMNETYFSLPDAEHSGLVLATEYYYDPVHKKHFEVPHEPSSGEEGAGSIVSTVLDYAKYLRVMMNESAPLSKAGHREVKTPRNFVISSKAPYTGPMTYAFGWNGAVFEGEQTYFHTGAVTNFVSAMMMIPSKQIAVAVFTNSDTRVPEVVAHHILWEHLGVPKDKRYDLNKQYQSERKDQFEYLQTCAERMYPSLPDPPYLPTLPISEHVGDFFDPGYGTLKVDLNCPRSVEKCKLRVLGVGGEGFSYLEPIVYLEPMSGNSWLGRGYLGGGIAGKLGIPAFCVPAEFKVDVHGTVTHLGIGVRLGEAGDPLTWFKRV